MVQSGTMSWTERMVWYVTLGWLERFSSWMVDSLQMAALGLLENVVLIVVLQRTALAWTDDTHWLLSLALERTLLALELWRAIYAAIGAAQKLFPIAY